MGLKSEQWSSVYQPPKTSSPLEIHIGELVLYGFPTLNVDQFRAEVEGELARLFEQGRHQVGWSELSGISHVEAGQFEVGEGRGIPGLGETVAQAIYRSMTGGGK